MEIYYGQLAQEEENKFSLHFLFLPWAVSGLDEAPHIGVHPFKGPSHPETPSQTHSV